MTSSENLKQIGQDFVLGKIGKAEAVRPALPLVWKRLSGKTIAWLAQELEGYATG